MNILVSACLMGINCKYNGGNNQNPLLDSLAKAHTLIPVCPEQLGGLATPRIPSERRGNKVVNQEGQDVTEAYRKGAEEAFRIAAACRCRLAILKDKSPSCGSDAIYDGTFSKTLFKREGVTAEHLRKNSIPVFHEHQAEDILKEMTVCERKDSHEHKD